MRKLLLIVLFSFLLVGCGNVQEKFLLENKYYNNNSITELDIDTFNELVENKESFAIFIYQPLCATSSNFEQVLNEFLEEYQISFYKMSFSDMKETELSHDIKYYPSFAIFYEGELVQALDANSDKDVNYYKSVDEFISWLTSYVELNN